MNVKDENCHYQFIIVLCMYINSISAGTTGHCVYMLVWCVRYLALGGGGGN